MTHECLAKSKVKCNFIYVVRYIKVPHQVSLCMCFKYLTLIHNKKNCILSAHVCIFVDKENLYPTVRKSVKGKLGSRPD